MKHGIQMNRFNLRTVLLIVVCAALAAAVSAAEIYTQPPDPAGGLYPSSWVDPNGSDADEWVWDDFTLAAAKSIREVRWRGGYTYDAVYGPVVDFTIKIYDTNATGGEPNVANPPLVTYAVGGNAGETIAGTFGGKTMYDYSFVLPTAFPAAAGKKYWVQIEGVQTVYPDWSIARGTGGDNRHFQFNRGAARYSARTGDAAFTLQDAATASYSISGQITLQFGGAGLGGVTVSAGGKSATTAPSGNFLISGLSAGMYTVTPAKAGYVFDPPSQDIAVGPSATGVDFKASPVATISGKVTLNGGGLPGVTVVAGSGFDVTAADGTYHISGLTPGQYYTSCAPLTGYAFAPDWILASATPDAVNVDFTATLVSNPAPVLTALTPPSAPQHGPAFSLTLDGGGFVGTSVVRWNGTARTTHYVSPSRLTADIPASALSSQGQATVTVFNPSPGGGVSAPKTFTIGNPVPVTQSLTPAGAEAGSAAIVLTVRGRDFLNSSVVRWNGADRVTHFGSATLLTANITAADLALPGTAQITVFNPAPDGGSSGPLTFTVGGFRISGKVTTNGVGQRGVTVRATTAVPRSGASTVPVSIPDNDPAGVESAISLTGPGDVESLEVELVIFHARIADLDVTLAHPDGTAVLLHNHSGAGKRDLYTSYPTPTAPAESLIAFSGKPLSGAWKLRLRDGVKKVSGALAWWRLTVHPAGGVVRSATTITDGTYSLLDVPAGTYAVSASRSGSVASPESSTVTVGPSATGIDFHLAPKLALASLIAKPAAVKKGKPTTLTATLTGVAPEDGAGVTLFSSNPNLLPVLASAAIAPGATSGEIRATAGSVRKTTKVTVLGRIADSYRTAVITIRK